MPGAGKTTLAASFIDHLKDNHVLAQSGSHRTILFYFFRIADPKANTVVSACRAILAQILQKHWRSQEVMDQFSFAMSESSGQTVASRNEVTSLARLSLSTIPDCFLILDGIDECFEVGPSINSLVDTFHVRTANIMYFSRPSGPGVRQLSRTIAPRHQLRIGESNSEDIENFCQDKLLELVNSDLLPELANSESTLSRLVSGAGGMFLWARLVMELLESPIFLDAWDRLKLLESIETPEGLDRLFNLILERLKLQGSAAVRVATNTFAWMLFRIQTELRGSPEGLRAGLYPEKKTPMPPIADFIQMVTMICCSLLELDNFGHLSFVHLSVRDFLRQLAEQAKGQVHQLPLPILSPISSHALISSSCLKYILVNFQASSWSPSLARSSFNLEFPLAAYAAEHWTTHAATVLAGIYQRRPTNVDLTSEHVEVLLSLVQRILTSPESITAWIELCFIFDVPRGSPGLFSTYNTLRLLVNSNNSSGRALTEGERSMAMVFEPLLAVFEYMQSLYATWGQKLVECPSIVWREAQVFDNPSSNFALKETESIKLKDLSPDLPASHQAGTQLLRSVSTLTTDNQLAVVTIWPSK